MSHEETLSLLRKLKMIAREAEAIETTSAASRLCKVDETRALFHILSTRALSSLGKPGKSEDEDRVLHDLFVILARLIVYGGGSVARAVRAGMMELPTGDYDVCAELWLRFGPSLLFTIQERRIRIMEGERSRLFEKQQIGTRALTDLLQGISSRYALAFNTNALVFEPDQELYFRLDVLFEFMEPILFSSSRTRQEDRFLADVFAIVANVLVKGEPSAADAVYIEFIEPIGAELTSDCAKHWMRIGPNLMESLMSWRGWSP